MRRQNLVSRRRAALLAAAGAIMAPAAPILHGATRTWDAGFGMTFTWSQPGNWNPNIEPTINDDAVFPSVVPQNINSVLLSSGEVARSLWFQNNYDLSGGSLTLGGTGSLAGVLTANPATSSFISSALHGSSSLIKDGSGTLTLSGATTAASAVRVDTGSLKVQGAGAISSVDGIVGTFAGFSGSMTLNGTSSTWTTSGSLSVGHQGNGSLTAESGGDVASSFTHIGSVSGSVGTVTVTGAGSNWTNSGFLAVGAFGTGTLNIQSGASASTSTGWVGSESSAAHGTVNVDGTGSSWTVGGPVIGDRGIGIMSVTAGADVLSTGVASIGRDDTGSGTVTVSGAGSTWSHNSELRMGWEGDAVLNVQAGASVTANLVDMGLNAGSSGTATVTGVGSTWTIDTDLSVGAFGTGALTVQNGGAVSNVNTHVGFNTAGSGTVTVTGAGSTFTASNELSVGDGGSGQLLISNGGSANAFVTYIGRFFGGNGAAVVSGAGSNLDSEHLQVGVSGAGSLMVQDGADVISSHGSVGGPFATGTATVTGAGSTWNSSPDLGIVNGTLSVLAGGSVSSGFTYLGYDSGTSGTAAVSGAGSVWTIGNDLQMCQLGSQGTLNITSGGAVTVNGNITDGGAGVSTITLDGGTLDMTSGNIGGATPVDNLNFRSGTLKNVAQINNGAGLTKTTAGTLTLAGTNAYTGDTTIAGGTLVASSPANLGNATFKIVFDGGTLRTDGSVGPLAISNRRLQINAGGGTIDSNGFNSFFGDLDGGGNFTKSGTGKITVRSIEAANVTINAGVLAVKTRAVTGGNQPAHMTSLSINPAAALDLNDNDLVVNSGVFTDVQALVLAGFGNTTGITSSTSDGTQILALFDNAQVGASDWLGTTISANAVVGKYTYFGDVNIDGQVSGDDYAVVDSNLDTDPPVGIEWLSGDANLDGIVTGDDYATIDSNLGLGSGNPLSSSALTSVPEPSCGGALVLLGTLCSHPRRRWPSRLRLRGRDV